MAKITKRLVDGTHPGDKDAHIWDEALPGFGLRVKPSGAKSYIIQYRNAEGRSRRLTLGKHGPLTPDQARGMAKSALFAAANGEDPAESKAAVRGGVTLEELSVRYIAEHAVPKKKPSSAKDDRQMLENHILPQLGAHKVTAIAREDVERLHNSLSERPYLANRVLALLSKMFNLAEKWRLRPDGSNPTRHIDKFQEQKRERYLSTAELHRLGKVLGAMEADPQENKAAIRAVRLLLLTGCRLGEILTLRWENVDHERGILFLPDSKTGQRAVVLSTPALELLGSAPQETGFVCPSPKNLDDHLKDLKGPWRRVKALAEAQQKEAVRRKEPKKRDRVDLSDVRIHDLRHSFASLGAGAGLSLPLIGQLLGHTQAQTTSRYAHLATDPLRAAADVVASQIVEAMEPKD